MKAFENTMHCLMVLFLVVFQEIYRTNAADNDVFLADKVVTKLFKGYLKDIRPRCGKPNTVMVNLDLALRQIIEINEPKQILHTNAWLRMSWTDCRLTWNASDLGGIERIVVPSTKVWTPDITLHDNSADHGLGSIKNYRIAVNHDGTTVYNIPTVFNSLCRIDTTYFPFDTQVCNLTFGMWAYGGFDVDIRNVNDVGDLSAFKENVEWRVKSLTALREAPIYLSTPYPQVIYTLNLRRKSFFYVLNLLFPCVLISTVAVLGFLLPPDAGEKVNLEITVMLSLAVFQLIVLDLMPPNSETLPIISIYFASTMILVGVSCLMTVIVLNIHFKGSQCIAVPPLAEKIFIRGFGRLVCVFRHYKEKKRKRKNTNEVVVGISYNCRKNSFLALNTNGVNSDDRRSVPHSKELPSAVIHYFKCVTDSLMDILNHMEEEESQKDLSEDWQMLALVIDRLFLFLYIVMSVGLFLAFGIEYSVQ